MPKWLSLTASAECCWLVHKKYRRGNSGKKCNAFHKTLSYLFDESPLTSCFCRRWPSTRASASPRAPIWGRPSCGCAAPPSPRSWEPWPRSRTGAQRSEWEIHLSHVAQACPSLHSGNTSFINTARRCPKLTSSSTNSNSTSRTGQIQKDFQKISKIWGCFSFSHLR